MLLIVTLRPKGDRAFEAVLVTVSFCSLPKVGFNFQIPFLS